MDRKFRRKFYEGITEHIEQHGRSIIGVPADREQDTPFAYTIGNACKPSRDGTAPLPELLIIGTTKGGVLNELSQQMLDAGAPFEDGQTVLLSGARLPVKIIQASSIAQTEYAIQAGQYFGSDDYPIMQVLIPDRNGKFPDEPGCQPPFSGFPVLRPHH